MQIPRLCKPLALIQCVMQKVLESRVKVKATKYAAVVVFMTPPLIAKTTLHNNNNPRVSNTSHVGCVRNLKTVVTYLNCRKFTRKRCQVSSQNYEQRIVGLTHAEYVSSLNYYFKFK